MRMSLPDLEVIQVSPSAKEFFGFDVNAPVGTVVGKKVPELLSGMAGYLDPPSAFSSDLGKDQNRVIKEVKGGHITYARLPVRFNRSHPAYRNKTFVPIITERRVFGEGDDRTILLQILYLDVAKLPKNLFTTQVWEEVIEDLDTKDLAQDFRSIKTVFDNLAFDEDWDKGETRRKALDAAIEKLEQGGPPSTLEDLSKAGWFELRDTASKMQKKPRKILDLIDTVLGRA